MARKTVHVSWPVVLAFTVLWLVVMALLYGPRFPRASGSEFRSVRSEQFGFSVIYPAKWRAHTYGEEGFRGQTEVKLRIFERQFGSFEITISRQAAPQPTVQDVAAWGAERIDRTNERLQGSSTPQFEAYALTEGETAGQQVLRRRYSNNRTEVEEIYIARTNDMIIITLDSDASAYESLLDEFNQIAESFRPIE